MRRRIPAFILGVLMLLSASTAMATWFDTFDGGFGQVWDNDHMTGGEWESPTFSFAVASDVLQVTDSTSANAGGAAVGLGYVDQPFIDTLVYGTLNPGNESNMNGLLGLFARGSGDNAYVLAVDYSNGAVSIIKNSTAGQTPIGTPAIISGFQNTDALYLEFSAIGTSLVGNVYNQSGGTLRASVSTTDSDYAAGVAGVAVQALDYDVALRGTFDDVGAVPEPGSLVLLGSGALCALGCWWRKRRRGKA